MNVMSGFNIVLTAAWALWLVYEIICITITAVTVRKSSEKVFTYDITSIVFILMLIFIAVFSLLARGRHIVTVVLMVLCAVLYIPMGMTIFTPQGIVAQMYKPGHGSNYIPAQNICYQYKQGKLFKDMLYIYDKGKSVAARRIIINIHDPRLTKMLNENYSKFGYENPMLRSE